MNDRANKLLVRGNKLNTVEDDIKVRENKLENNLKDNLNKTNELNKKESDLNNRQQLITEKENDLTEKEEELKNRQLEITKKIQQLANASTGKVVYLTFDDGPSPNTSKILDILKKNNINGTFFVNGHSGYESTYLRIINEGNKIGNHTYSHDYGDVYSSVEGFNADVDKLNNYLVSIGVPKPNLIRFPGGSNNTVSIQYGGKTIMNSLINDVTNKGYDYIDWNVSSSDATAITVDKQTIIDSVKNGCEGKNSVVILFHDSQPKTTTVEALPEIIKYLIDKGYTFKTLEPGCAPWAKLS